MARLGQILVWMGMLLAFPAWGHAAPPGGQVAVRSDENKLAAVRKARANRLAARARSNSLAPSGPPNIPAAAPPAQAPGSFGGEVIRVQHNQPIASAELIDSPSYEANDIQMGQTGCAEAASACPPNCCCKKCCAAIWPHKCSVWGGFLYLHAGDVDMAHAIQQNGTGGAGTVPDGRVGVAAPEYEPAFIVGANVALSGCTSIWSSWTHFESRTTNSLELPPGVGGTVSSLVLHPGTLNAGSTSSFVTANYDINFELFDIQLMRLLSASRCHAINYHVGARYAKLEQEFRQLGVFAPPTGDLNTSSLINFEGVGPRVGLDGRANLGRCGFSVYGNSFATFLIGKFDSTYEQFNETTTTREAFSVWDDNRMVPLVETEVGLSWTNCKGCLRLSVGYQLQWWFNAITVGDHVRAVQNSNFVDVGDTIAFDGLTSRVEWRF